VNAAANGANKSGKVKANIEWSLLIAVHTFFVVGQEREFPEDLLMFFIQLVAHWKFLVFNKN